MISGVISFQGDFHVTLPPYRRNGNICKILWKKYVFVMIIFQSLK